MGQRQRPAWWVYILVVMVVASSVWADPVLYVVDGFSGQRPAPPRTLYVVDTELRKVIKQIPVGNSSEPYADVIIDPDGQVAYVPGFYDDQVYVIDLVHDRIVETIPVPYTPARGALRPDGELLFVTTPGNNAVAVIDISTRRVIDEVVLPFEPLSIAMSNDGQTVFVGPWGRSRKKGLVLIDAESCDIKSSIPLPVESTVTSINPSPNGKEVVLTGSMFFDGRWVGIAIIDLEGERVAATIGDGAYQKAALSKDGQRLFAANDGGNAFSIVNLVTGETLGEALQQGQRQEAAAIGLDGRVGYGGAFWNVGVVAVSGSVRVIELEGGQEIATVGRVGSVPITFRAANTEILCGNGGVDEGEECDDGNRSGGDGCAVNCTTEASVVLDVGGSRSRVVMMWPEGSVDGLLKGKMRLRVGGPVYQGRVPVVALAKDVGFGAVMLPGVGCLCLGVNEGVGPESVVLEGEIGCGANILDNVNYYHGILHDGSTRDPTCRHGIVEGLADPHPGACNITKKLYVGANSPGSAVLEADLVAGLTLNQEKCSSGKDGDGCRGLEPEFAVQIGALSTGYVTSAVTGVNNGPKNMTNEQRVAGNGFDCDKVQARTSDASVGVVFRASAPLLHAGALGDVILDLFIAGESTTVCAGDCDGGGAVTVEELVRGVAVALGEIPLAECRAFDEDGDGEVAVAELVGAIRAALNGC